MKVSDSESISSWYWSRLSLTRTESSNVAMCTTGSPLLRSGIMLMPITMPLNLARISNVCVPNGSETFPIN